MIQDALDMLVCPQTLAPLELRSSESLHCPSSGKTYPVRGGIARLVDGVGIEQLQVNDCFSFKWKEGDWGYHKSHKSVNEAFFRDRFCFSSDEDLKSFFFGKTVLHAGVGNGHIEQYYLHHCKRVWGVDITESVDALAANWMKYYPNLARRFFTCQADLMALPFRNDIFDIILSDGVLHHTPDTFLALKSITKKVKLHGHIMFYVYLKKSPIREFVDDHIRQQIKDMPPEDAWKAMEPLTAFAKDLSNQNQTINVPEDCPLLGFKKGNFNLQRWMYWNMFKFYWNDAFSFDDNNHVNYDWYYPAYCWRHTPEEVQSWLSELNLEEVSFNVTESGISVIAKRLV